MTVIGIPQLPSIAIKKGEPKTKEEFRIILEQIKKENPDLFQVFIKEKSANPETFQGVTAACKLYSMFFYYLKTLSNIEKMRKAINFWGQGLLDLSRATSNSSFFERAVTQTSKYDTSNQKEKDLLHFASWAISRYALGKDSKNDPKRLLLTDYGRSLRIPDVTERNNLRRSIYDRSKVLHLDLKEMIKEIYRLYRDDEKIIKIVSTEISRKGSTVFSE